MGCDKENLNGNSFVEVDTLSIIMPLTQDRAECMIVTVEATRDVGLKHLVVVSAILVLLFLIPFLESCGTILRCSKLGISFTIIRLPQFLDNPLGSIKSSQLFFFLLEYSCASHGKDIGKSNVSILVNPKRHSGQTYTPSQSHTVIGGDS